MTDVNTLVPQGVSHDVDLSGMKPEQRQLHHAAQMRIIGFYQGKAGIDDYRRQHPDAKAFVELQSLAYVPKPAGYVEAAADIVRHWFDSDVALSATNRADVIRLNGRLQTDRFDPGSHFSKPMSPALRKRVAVIFDQRGAKLPTAAKSLSDARKAVRAFKNGTQASADAFGGIGSRTAKSLTIGQRTFAIVEHGSRECIRVTAGGKTQRVPLDILEVILSGLPDGIGGETSALTTTCSITELVQNNETGLPDGAPDTICGRPCPNPLPIDQSAADLVQGCPLDPALSDKIASLRADQLANETVAADRLAAALAAADAAGCDILDL